MTERSRLSCLAVCHQLSSYQLTAFYLCGYHITLHRQVYRERRMTDSWGSLTFTSHYSELNWGLVSPTLVVKTKNCLYQGNVEHCGLSVSKQCTSTLNYFVAKALPVKYQITAHRPCMHGIYRYNKVCICLIAQRKLSCLQTRACHEVVPHNGAICPTMQYAATLVVVHGPWHVTEQGLALYCLQKCLQRIAWAELYHTMGCSI